jgi:uncharacterized protein
MFPLSSVLFPHATLPLHVFEPRYRELVDHCLAGDGEFGVVLIARGSEVGGGDERFAVGTMARITAAAPFDDGRWVLMAEGRGRFAVSQWLADAPYPVAEVTDLPEDDLAADDERWDRASTAVRRVRTLMSELGAEAPVVADPPTAASAAAANGSDGGRRLWRLCQLAPVTALDSQKLLEAADGGARLCLLSEMCEALAGDLSQLLGGPPGS